MFFVSRSTVDHRKYSLYTRNFNLYKLLLEGEFCSIMALCTILTLNFIIPPVDISRLDFMTYETLQNLFTKLYDLVKLINLSVTNKYLFECQQYSIIKIFWGLFFQINKNFFIIIWFILLQMLEYFYAKLNYAILNLAFKNPYT